MWQNKNRNFLRIPKEPVTYHVAAIALAYVALIAFL